MLLKFSKFFLQFSMWSRRVSCRWQVLQQDQLSRIRDMEHELTALRSRHTETILQLKKAFLQEKHDCQANADKQISEMSKQANQVF